MITKDAEPEVGADLTHALIDWRSEDKEILNSESVRKGDERVDGKFLGFNVDTTIESQEIFSFSRKENVEIEAIIPTKFRYPDEDRDNMFEEEIHKLLANDVTCNLLEVDGSDVEADIVSARPKPTPTTHLELDSDT